MSPVLRPATVSRPTTVAGWSSILKGHIMQLTPALEALIDQRLALINELAAPLTHEHDLIVTPLTEPHHMMTLDEWERSCDICRKVCVYPAPFWTGHAVRSTKHGQQLLITFGVCEEHKP